MTDTQTATVNKETPVAPPPELYVVFCFADNPAEWNCSQWRSLTPSSTFNLPGTGMRGKLVHVSGFLDFLNPAVQDLVAPCDVIVFQRNIISDRAFDAMEYWQGMGKPVVVDLDDAYQMLPWCNPAHEFWHERDGGAAMKMLEEGLRRSDGLLAPNRLLLKDWEYCTRGYYLQNYAEEEWWNTLLPRKTLKAAKGLKDKIVIGWGGSVSHYDSWWGSGIFDAARRVSDRHPEVVWLMCGNDFRLFHQLPVHQTQKLLQPGVPPEQWPQVVRHFDIGVAPLFGPYDQRRSWIKGIEYLLAGVPWVATGGEPYGDIANLGTLIENGVDNWEAALELKIANLAQEQTNAASLEQQARKLFLAPNQLDTYKRVFTNIKEDFHIEKGRLPGVIYV